MPAASLDLYDRWLIERRTQRRASLGLRPLDEAVLLVDLTGWPALPTGQTPQADHLLRLRAA